MRAKEFIIERELSDRKSDTLSTTYHFPTMPSADGYQAYRFGIAMANHEIANVEGPSAQHAVIVAYTPEEENIIQSASKKTGHKGKLLANKGSKEPKSTNVASPVATPKRNRYGV
jgi:hypothetical protein